MKKSKYYYSGAIHIHTQKSDGTGNIQEISKAAKKSGLSFIIITDHNYYDTEEGFYNGVCVIKGEELSPDNGNHYLALGINQFISNNPDNPYENTDNVRKNGGFGFAAHPDESDNRKNKNKPLKWLDKSVDVDGIEIWNWFSDWADNYDDGNIFKIAYSYLFRQKLIKGANEKTLEWWDFLNNKNSCIVPAIGGVDAHALKIKKYIIPVTIFRYEYMFKTVTNSVILDNPLTKSFEECKKEILSSLRKGQNIIINKKINTNSVIIFKIANENAEAYSGDKIYLDDKTFLTTELPCNATICIFKNGQEIHKQSGRILKYKIEKKGKYRIQAFYKNKPYVYSNPILVE